MKTLTLREVREGAQRASKRVALWPEWQRRLTAQPRTARENVNSNEAMIWRCVWCHAILSKTAERCWMCELIKDIRRTDTVDLSDTDDHKPPEKT